MIFPKGSRFPILLGSFMLMVFSAFGQPFIPLRTEIGLSHLYDPTAHIGGGAVIIDINNDGFMDVYLPGGRGGERMLLNNNGEYFTDISHSSMLTMLNNFYTLGGVAGDFNNDGYEDLFITTWQFVETGGGPNFNASNQLLYNNGDNTFTNVGGMAGIYHPAFSASATLLDVNMDGLLDIYVVDYVEQSEFTFDHNGTINGFAHQCFANKLYINNMGLFFENEAEAFQVDDQGCGLAVVATNYNGDEFTDLMVVNDFGQWVLPNKLFAGQANGFEDVSEATATEIGIYAMGVAIGDYDEDGDLDYYFTNIGRNVLLAQESDGPWIDKTTEAGVEDTDHNGVLSAGWSTFFFDFDNDSYLDLYVSNGRMPALPFINNIEYVPNRLYRNDQDGTFTEVTTEMNLLDSARGRGAVFFDFNNDGKIDILQVNIYEQFNEAPSGTVLYLNNIENDNNYVMFALKSVTSAPHGIGAQVKLYAGGRMLIREVDPGSGFASHNDKRVHFGLGEMTQIDSVELYWPGNLLPQTIYNPEINQIHEVLQEKVMTSVQKINQNMLSVEVFPNPANESFFLKTNSYSTLQISLFDQWGRMVNSTVIQPEEAGVHALKGWAASLNTGIYTLVVSDGNQSRSVRVAVVR